MIRKEILKKLYSKQNKSMQEIADFLGCSLHKVDYWMKKYRVPSRSRSDATYLNRNPKGDPFKFKKPTTIKEAELFGLGLGLFWGEGTRSNKNSIRLGNSDPALSGVFIEFLVVLFNIKKTDLKFGLQIFNDISPAEALNFWCRRMGVKKTQFQKVVVTPSRGQGTYKKKLKYGVLTVHYNNKKLRELLGKELENYGFKE